ncbi:hypothetical protein FRC09_020559 [Ceratobasidium sp. 395]|nr:hypothetical protein FRC09_020559 [Ceratobasidium sp. 395]
MVSPWMDNRTLLQYISRNPTVDRYQLCVGISEGVAYLHQSGLIHGDIKSANVLISNEGVAKISDFGCSELKTSTLCFTTTSVLKLSIRWAAPEILDGPVLRSREADVYALGMTLLEAVTGMVPFSSMQDRAVYIAVVVQRQIPKRPRRFPSFSLDEADKLWEMIVDTCAYSSPDRPSSITVRDRVRDVKHRLRQSMLDHSVIDFSVDAVEDQSDEGDDDDDYDEWDEWNEYDENDEYDEHESIQHTPEAEKPADLVAHASLLQSRLPPPKKPLSTWQLFFVEYLQNYKKTYPERKINPAREGRDAGAIYKALTSEQKEASKSYRRLVHFANYIKQVYKRQSRLAKKNYQRELDAWVHTTHATQTVSIPTAWQLFFAEYLRSYKSSDPGQKLNVIHAAQDGGAAYRALTSEQKEMYKRKAVVLKKRFECGDVERTQIHASNDAQKAGGAKIRRSNSGDFHASKKSINAYPMSLQWILADQARVKESLRSETKAENSVLAAAKWRMLSDAEKARREKISKHACRAVKVADARGGWAEGLEVDWEIEGG